MSYTMSWISDLDGIPRGILDTALNHRSTKQETGGKTEEQARWRAFVLFFKNFCNETITSCVIL